MKKILLLLIIPFNVVFSQTTERKGFKDESGEIFEYIRNHEYSKVRTNFDSSLSARVDTAKIRQVWEAVLKMAGDYVSVNDTVIEQKDDETLVIQHLTFEKGKIDFKLLYAADKKIKGISFSPKGIREKYKMPSYNRADLMKERPLTVQNGPFNLAGTLTTPTSPGRFPVVLMVHGSGRNDRDESVGSLKIFKDLAIGLSAKGISVYRYEKRTRAYAGKMAKDRTMTVYSETIDDAVAAIKTLKADSTVDTTAIYMCGFSMGGMLLPRIAEKVSGIKGLIYLAASARPLEDQIVEQTEYIVSLDDTSGKDHKAIIDSVKNEAAKIKILKKSDTDSSYIFQLPRAYWLDLNTYKPLKMAQGLKMPMFFLHGGRDYQVTEADYNIWKKGLTNPQVKFKLYPDMNHFFVKGEEKSTPLEYNKSANVNIEVIEDIASWILSTKK